MRRRTFIQSVLGTLAMVYCPAMRLAEGPVLAESTSVEAMMGVICDQILESGGIPCAITLGEKAFYDWTLEMSNYRAGMLPSGQSSLPHARFHHGKHTVSVFSSPYLDENHVSGVSTSVLAPPEGNPYLSSLKIVA